MSNDSRLTPLRAPALFFFVGVVLLAQPVRAALAVTLPPTGTADKDVRDAVGAVVRAAPALIPGLTSQSLKETQAVLASMRELGVACAATTTECALRLGGLAGAQIVVNVNVDNVDQAGGGVIVSLSAVDITRQRAFSQAPVVRLTTRAPALTADQQAEIQAAVVRIIAPEQERGSLEIVSSRGVAVVVDGTSKGTTPLPPLRLAPGSHLVWFGAVGFESEEHRVSVTFGATTRLEVSLQPEPGAAVPDRLPPTTGQPVGGGDQRRIAVYDVVGNDVAPHLPPVVRDALLAELRKLEGVEVVSLGDLRKDVDAVSAREELNCAGDAGCLAGLAENLGADTLVTVQITSLEGHSFYGAKRLDTASLTGGSVQEKLDPDRGREFVEVTGLVVERLFPEVPLVAGATRGASAELLARASPPPLSPVWPLATGGVAVVGAVAAAAFGGLNLVLRGDDVSARRAEQFTAAGFVGAVVVTALGASACAVTAWFTDWSPAAPPPTPLPAPDQQDDPQDDQQDDQSVGEDSG